jgi:hypothetical protein
MILNRQNRERGVAAEGTLFGLDEESASEAQSTSRKTMDAKKLLSSAAGYFFYFGA